MKYPAPWCKPGRFFCIRASRNFSRSCGNNYRAISCFLCSAVRGACFAYRKFARTPARNFQVAEQRHGPIETSGETPCAARTVLLFFWFCFLFVLVFPVARAAAQLFSQ